MAAHLAAKVPVAPMFLQPNTPVVRGQDAVPIIDAARSVSTEPQLALPPPADIERGVLGAQTVGPAISIQPGKERWPVKTGTDEDVAKVDATKLVESTVTELGSLPRPGDLMPATGINDAYNSKRAVPTETTVWRVKAKVTALKLEADGDYHLVLQDDGGSEMVAEIPYPDNAYVATSSPFFDDVKSSRAAVDTQFGQIVATLNFVPGAAGKLVPDAGLYEDSAEVPVQPKKIVLRSDLSPTAFANSDLFSARITAVGATVTGVGFFDRAHGQTGMAPNVIELHPVLAIVFDSQSQAPAS